MTTPKTPRNAGPGGGTLTLILVALALGCLTAGLGAHLAEAPGPWLGALGGWAWAGVLGVSGWWTSRRALRGGQTDLLKFMLGGMLVRMLLCGAGAGVVIGTGWLDQNGFVLGLLGGIVVFLGIEIGGLQISARRAGSAEGATGRGC